MLAVACGLLAIMSKRAGTLSAPREDKVAAKRLLPTPLCCKLKVDGRCRPGGDQRTGTPMSIEENKYLVRSFRRAQNEGDLAALEEMMSPDFVDHCVLP